MLIHIDQKLFQCGHCDKNSRQKQLLIRHQNKYHNQDVLANYLNIGSSIPGMDTLTVLNSDKEDVVNSFEAGKDVSDPMEEDIQSLDVIIDLKKESSIRKHLIKHTSEGSQNCKICNKVFKNRSSLRKHLINNLP